MTRRERRRLLIVSALTMALLPGCTRALQPYTDRAVQERMAMNDAQAYLAQLGICDVSIGAAVRAWTPAQLELAFMVCNPQAQATNIERLVAPGAEE